MYVCIYIYIHVYTFLNLSLSLCRYISQSTHTKKHSTSGTSHDVDYLRTLTASPWASEDCLATCCGTTRRCSRWTWHRKRDMDATAPRLSMVGVFFGDTLPQGTTNGGFFRSSGVRYCISFSIIVREVVNHPFRKQKTTWRDAMIDCCEVLGTWKQRRVFVFVFG